MNGIENISKRILSEARDKAEQIIKEAEAVCAKLEAEAMEKAGREEAELAKTGKARVEDIAEKAKLNAGIETRKIIAGKKQQLIGEAFEKALKRLLDLPRDEYAALLASLAAKACGDGEAGELLLNKKDLAEVGPKVLDGANRAIGKNLLTLAGDAAPILGGVVVRRGKIEINCSFEVIVRMLQEDISGEVAALLFDRGA